MIIPDTSIWIEFLKKKEGVFDFFRREMEYGNILAVSCIFGELLQGAKGTGEERVILGYWQNLPKISDEGLLIDAGLYSRSLKLVNRGVGLIDAAIVVAANRSNAKIWTLDKRLAAVLDSKRSHDPTNP